MTIVVPAGEFTAESIFPNAPNAGATAKPFPERSHGSWLGCHDSNLGMAKSKSAYLSNDFKAHLEKRPEIRPRGFNCLAAVSK
jgi:hypothetical protein